MSTSEPPGISVKKLKICSGKLNVTEIHYTLSRLKH